MLSKWSITNVFPASAGLQLLCSFVKVGVCRISSLIKCWEVCSLGAGPFTTMHKTLPCWGWTPALCSCKNYILMLKKRADFLSWGPGWTEEGTEEVWEQLEKRCCDSTEIRSQFSPVLYQHQTLLPETLQDNTSSSHWFFSSLRFQKGFHETQVPRSCDIWPLLCCDNVGLSTLNNQSCSFCPTQKLTLSQVRFEQVFPNSQAQENLWKSWRGAMSREALSWVNYSGIDDIAVKIVQAKLWGIELVWIHV